MTTRSEIARNIWAKKKERAKNEVELLRRLTAEHAAGQEAVRLQREDLLKRFQQRMK